MKAIVKTKAGHDNMELLEVESPKIHDGLVKVKVAYSGICGTDIHTFKGEYGNTYPVILGHEFSGVVTEVGTGVTHVKVGDRITSETTFAICGKCEFCKTKDYNLCSSRKGVGTAVDGSMAEEILLRGESVHVLADNISLKEASLTEPLACCVHAVLEKTTVKATNVVLVMGPGPIGNLVAQVAKSQNAVVVLAGITKDKERLDLAKELGIDYTVDLLTEDLSKVIMDLTDGYGADRVFDCTGAIQAVNQGLTLTKKKGHFVQVGLFATPQVNLDTESIIQREIEYIGCRSQKPSSWVTALKLMADKKVELEKLITKEVSLENWREGFEAVMQGSEMKVLIKSDNSIKGEM